MSKFATGFLRVGSNQKKPFSKSLVITFFRGKDRQYTKVFDSGPVVVGRSPDCDFIISEPFVSRTHFQVVEEDAEFWIVDLGSSNGLLINGRRVHKEQISHGFELPIESIKLQFKMTAKNSQK